MGLKVGELYATMSLRDREFQEGMRQNKSKLSELGGRMTTLGKTMTRTATIPIAALGTAILGLTKKTADYGTEVAVTSEQVGVNTEALQRLRYAMGQIGVEQSTVDRALGRLNQRIGRAIDGNEQYATALEGLGVNLSAVQDGTLDAEQAFMQVVNAINQMEEPFERSAAAGELFGTRLGRDLMPVLEAGQDEMLELMDRADELGVVMGDESVRASRELGDAFDELNRVFHGAYRQIGQELVPIFNDVLIPVVRDSVVPMVLSLVQGIAGLVESFGNLDPRLQQAIIAFTAAVAALGPILVVVGHITTAVGALTPVLSGLASVIQAAVIPAIVAKGIALAPILIAIGALAAAVAALRVAWDRDFLGMRSTIQRWRRGTTEDLSAVEDGLDDVTEKTAEASEGFEGMSTDLEDIGEQLGTVSGAMEDFEIGVEDVVDVEDEFLSFQEVMAQVNEEVERQEELAIRLRREYDGAATRLEAWENMIRHLIDTQIENVDVIDKAVEKYEQWGKWADESVVTFRTAITTMREMEEAQKDLIDAKDAEIEREQEIQRLLPETREIGVAEKQEEKKRYVEASEEMMEAEEARAELTIQKAEEAEGLRRQELHETMNAYDQFNQGILDGVAVVTDQYNTMWQDLGQLTVTSLGDAFSEILRGTESFGEAFRGFFNTLADQILDTLARVAAAEIFQFIVTGGVGGMLPGGIMGLGQVFMGGAGGIGGLGGIFHQGGIVPGALGRERIISAQAGEIVAWPHQIESMIRQAVQSGGGNTRANIYVELDGRTIARATGRHLADELHVKAGPGI